jgi:signal transduction histidine kinase
MPPFTPELLASVEHVVALKRRLIAAASALCLLILGVASIVAITSLNDGLKEKQQDIGRATHVMGRHTAQLIEAVDAVLLETMDDVKEAKDVDPYKLHLMLKGHAQHIKAINEIVLIGPDGLGQANSLRHPTSGVNVGGRSYFTYHRDNPNGGLFISEPLQRPLTNVWNITLSRRITAKDGSFNGVLLIAVSPDYFTSLYSSLGFGHEYAITLFRKDAMLLARFPAAPELLGKVFGRHPEARAFFDGDADSLSTRFARPNVDEKPNLVEFRRVPGYPLVITSSVPEQVVHDDWRELALGIGSVAGISILIVIAVFFVLLQEIDRRAEAQHKAAEEILRSNADLEQFAYAVSHDLKAPLRTVGGFLELLNRKHGEGLPNEAREYLLLAKGGAKRMQEMIEALLDYSRIHRQAHKPVEVDLNGCCNEAIAGLQAILAETKAKIAVDSMPKVMGDPAQLTRLFQNLIGNALKYRKPGVTPEVKLAVKLAGSDWEIAVNDNGIGIEPGQTNKLFKVFSRLHSAESYEGTGIGLALCRSIVERHGGRIWVDSEGEGKGSVFAFTIPRAA